MSDLSLDFALMVATFKSFRKASVSAEVNVDVFAETISAYSLSAASLKSATLNSPNTSWLSTLITEMRLFVLI